MIHVKLRDSLKTRWLLSRWKKSRRSLVTFPTVGINTIDIHEKHDLSWEILGKLGDSWKPQVSAPLLSFAWNYFSLAVSYVIWKLVPGINNSINTDFHYNYFFAFVQLHDESRAMQLSQTFTIFEHKKWHIIFTPQICVAYIQLHDESCAMQFSE